MVAVVRGTLATALGMAALAASVHARADIDPPAGYDWVRSVRVVVENTLPDHVLVLWPCYGGPQLSLEPYCVIRAGDTVDPNGLLYALPAKAVKLEKYAPTEPDPRARPGEVVIVDPKIRHGEAKFFKDDPRVVRPGFALDGRRLGMAPSDTGIAAATYFVQVERAGEKGVEARFVRAKYRCRSGGEVELGGPKQDEPPIPSCSVDDDHGRPMLLGDAGPVKRGATGELPEKPAPRRLLSLSPKQAIWLGALVSSLGLIAFGVVAKRKRS
jgi:hypothetical protein